MRTTIHPPRDSDPFALGALVESYRPAAPDARPSLPRVEPLFAPVVVSPRRPTRRPLLWFFASQGALALLLVGAVAFAARARPTPLVLHSSADAVRVDAPRVVPHEVPVRALAASVTDPVAPPPPRSTRARARRAAPPAASPVAAVPRAPSPAAPAVARAPAHRWETGGEGPETLAPSIDELLDGAVGDSDPDPVRTERAAVALPETPTRRQVSTTLRALEGEVGQCGEGDVTVRLMVDGGTGRVLSASVSGAPDASTAACVASVVRTAHFPRFERARFTVAFPYRL